MLSFPRSGSCGRRVVGRSLCAVVVPMLLVLVTAEAVAQAAEHSVEARSVLGVVHDRTRGPIAGARVTALPGDGRDFQLSTVTDTSGTFRLLLTPGIYILRSEAMGFKDVWKAIAVIQSSAATCEIVMNAIRHQSSRPDSRRLPKRKRNRT